MTKETIVANLQRAIEVVEATPAEKICLGFFKADCGTLFCTAGLLTLDPHFKAQGMELREYACRGFRLFNAKNPDPKQDPYDYEWLDHLFGEWAFARLFDTYGAGDFDGIYFCAQGEEPISDKELALYRLRHQLREYERCHDHG